MTSRECKACVCVHVCQPQTVPRYAFSLHFIYSIIKSHEDYSSPSPSIYLSPPLLLHVFSVLSHILRHNPSEYWRVVAEFRLDLCSADRLHHPGGPLSPSEIVVSAIQYYCHAPQSLLQADASRFHTNIQTQTYKICAEMRRRNWAQYKGVSATMGTLAHIWTFTNFTRESQGILPFLFIYYLAFYVSQIQTIK